MTHPELWVSEGSRNSPLPLTFRSKESRSLAWELVLGHFTCSDPALTTAKGPLRNLLSKPLLPAGDDSGSLPALVADCLLGQGSRAAAVVQTCPLPVCTDAQAKRYMFVFNRLGGRESKNIL